MQPPAPDLRPGFGPAAHPNPPRKWWADWRAGPALACGVLNPPRKWWADWRAGPALACGVLNPPRKWWAFGPGLASGVLMLALGCAPARPIFPEVSPPIVWPAPPAAARIRYIGQLRSAADLNAPPKLFQTLGDWLLGAPVPPELYGPRSVVCTADGQRVWVADPGGRCLHQFDLERRGYQKVERAGPTRLLTPVGVCLGPDETLYVCDAEDVAIHRLAADSGALVESLTLPEEVHRPVAVRYDPVADELYVADVAGHDVKILGRDGALRRVVGTRGAKPGEFNFPCDVALDGDTVWVVDTGNYRVQGLTQAGAPHVTFGQAGDAPGDLALPKGLALDSDGHLYVVDGRFENVQVFDRRGQLLLVFGQEGTGPGQLWLPGGIFIDPQDRIWVCDSYNRRVQVFQYLRTPEASGDAAQPMHENRRPTSAPRGAESR